MTERQKQILIALIESFIESGHDVSSFDLMKNSQIGVSSATLRNEFLVLSEDGYVTKSHFASGRLPTIKGLSYYINNLMQEDDPEFLRIVTSGQKLFQERFDEQALLHEAMKTLHEWSSEPVFVLYRGVIQFYRISRLLDAYKNFPKKIQKEYLEGLMKFWDVIEDPELFRSLLSKKRDFPRGGVGVFSGTDLGWKELENFIAVFSPFKLLDEDTEYGYIGAIGYSNLQYKKVVPALRALTDILNNILRGW